jgi:hypothetical protein
LIVVGMWKALGMETVPVAIGDVWQERLIELSKRRKGAPRFRKLMGQADFRYFHDAIRDVHTFFFRFDPATPMEDLEFLRDYILELHELSEDPVVSFADVPQKFTVVLTADEEVDDHKKRNAWWENEESEETQSI